MVYRVGPKSLSGHSQLHNKLSTEILKPMLIDLAKRSVVAASIAAITDNSGGAAADGTIGAIPAITGFTESGTASAQKAELETSFGAVKDAITELGSKASALLAVVPACDFTDNSGGTTADGTIAAIDASMTAVNTSIAAVAGVQTVRTNIMNAIATLAVVTNRIRYALGLSLITDNSGGTPAYPLVVPALSVSTGTASDGTAAGGTSKTEVDAMLAAMAAAVKELATALNACRAVSAPAAVTVVAVAAEQGG